MIKLITPVNDINRRDLPVADTTLLNPTTAGSGSPIAGSALEQGEWLTPNASSGKLERVAAASVPDCFPMFTQKGDFSAQAIGRATVLQLHEFEADTDMYDDAQTYVVGEPLCAKLVTVDGYSRGVLTNQVSADTDYIVGYVAYPLPSANSGNLRFRRVPPHLLAG